MKTRLSFFTVFLLIFFCTSAFSYTTPGTGVVWNGDSLVVHSDGAVTWNASFMQFEFHEEIEIAATDSVVIMVDVHSDHSGAPDIRVNGIFALGVFDSTGVDSLTLTGNVEDDGPGGIRVEDGGLLHLKKVRIPGYGPNGNDVGVRNVGGMVYVDACRIFDWNRYAMSFSGGDGEVSNCSFHDNCQWVINITLGSSPYIHHCTFIRNNEEGSSAKNPISVGVQGSNSPVIEDCYIEGQDGNPHGGVSVWVLSGNQSNAVIRRVTVVNASFGIVVMGVGANVTITDCVLHNNTAMPDPMTTGSGITIQQGSIATIARCDITGNYWGITTYQGSSEAHLGDVNSIDPDEMGHNHIYENGNNNTLYNFYNNTSLPQTAQNNDWGSQDPDEVEVGIYHQPDDGSLGLVTYLPLWQYNTPPVITEHEPTDSLLSVILNGSITFSITAEDEQSEELDYQFTLDDEIVSETSSANITFSEVGDHFVRGRATDELEEYDEYTWRVTVLENHPPEIIEWSPEELSVEIDAHDEQLFSITATDEDDDSLSYEFWLDSELVSTVDSYLFQEYGLDTTEYYLTAIVFDTHQASDTLQWYILVINDIEDDNELLPNEFSLYTYPNPFNSVIQIGYTIPEAGQVEMQVFNTLGRCVQTLVSGHHARGNYSTYWDAMAQGSGVYYLQVINGTESHVKQLILVK